MSVHKKKTKNKKLQIQATLTILFFTFLTPCTNIHNWYLLFGRSHFLLFSNTYTVLYCSCTVCSVFNRFEAEFNNKLTKQRVLMIRQEGTVDPKLLGWSVCGMYLQGIFGENRMYDCGLCTDIQVYNTHTHI